MRIGATSYIYPADILTNVIKLAGRVQDIELIIFEVGDDGADLPDNSQIKRMRQIAIDSDLTFTVHLPLDLKLASKTPSINKVELVINRFAELQPTAYIIHLDAEKNENYEEEWIPHSLASLDALNAIIGAWNLICVENLESHPPAFINEIIDSRPARVCIDIGHLWKLGLDAAALTEQWLERAVVIHLHGVGARDHKSLEIVSADLLDSVVCRIAQKFNGVLTFEVFNESDWLGSRKAFNEALLRTRQTDGAGC